MRHICLDTETTGFDPTRGDRIVEIACVETQDFMPTGRVYHQYINPMRSMPEEAFKVHGLSEDFLKDYPVFKDISADFIKFIDSTPLVIHNAKFDMKFINYELTQCGLSAIPMQRAIDTLLIARKKFPGSPATLDALCKRFNISLKERDLHGALIDTRLLAEVFLHLNEGYAPRLDLDKKQDNISHAKTKNTVYKAQKRPKELPNRFSSKDQDRHVSFLKQKIKNALWIK